MYIVLYGVPAQTAEKLAARYHLKLIYTPEDIDSRGFLLLVPRMTAPRQLLAFYNAMLRHEDEVDAVIVCGVETCGAASTVQYCSPPGKFFSLGGGQEPEEQMAELCLILDTLSAEGNRFNV